MRNAKRQTVLIGMLILLAAFAAGCFQEAKVTESWTGPSNGTSSTGPRRGLLVQRANGTVEVVPLATHDANASTRLSTSGR